MDQLLCWLMFFENLLVPPPICAKPSLKVGHGSSLHPFQYVVYCMPKATKPLTLKSTLHKLQAHHWILTEQPASYLHPEDHIGPMWSSWKMYSSGQPQLQLAWHNICILKRLLFFQFMHLSIIQVPMLWSNLLLPCSGWMNWFKLILKWQGGRKFVWYYNRPNLKEGNTNSIQGI